MGPNKRVGPIGTTFSLRWVMKEAKGVDFLNWSSTLQHPDAAESKAQLRYCRCLASNIISHLSPIHWIQIAAFVQFIAASITSLIHTSLLGLNFHVPFVWISFFIIIINQVHNPWSPRIDRKNYATADAVRVFSNPMTRP
jgi:hypothetical protein